MPPAKSPWRSLPSGTAGGAHQSVPGAASLLMTLHNVPWAAVCRFSRWAKCRSRAKPLPSKFSRSWPVNLTNKSEFRDELNASHFGILKMRQSHTSGVISSPGEVIDFAATAHVCSQSVDLIGLL